MKVEHEAETTTRGATGWRRVFTLDLRSLALCRISTGLVVVADLVTRLQTFRLHYTDDGILPRQALYDFQALSFPSAYAMSGSFIYLGLLFLFHGVVALCLAAGYRTRLASLLTWYLTLSLQERLFMANNGGDKMLISVLFWGLFLPWGATLSVDAGRHGKKEDQVLSAATVVFVLQPITVYWISVLHKIEPTWLKGEVLCYALQSDFYAFPWGMWLLPYPTCLRMLAYFTLLWEVAGPFFILSTRPRWRVFGCLTFLVMHLGFGLFLRIGIFAFSPGLYMLGLLPSLVWTWPGGIALASSLRGVFDRGRPVATLPSGRLRRPVSVLVGALFLYTALTALSQDRRIGRLLPAALDGIGQMTGLNQRWSVFVDSRNIFDGWLVVEALLSDGRDVDLFQGNEPVRWGKPRTPYRRYDSFRWPTPLVVITGDLRYQKWFVRALALDWQREHPGDKVAHASLILFRESPRLSGINVPVERLVLWEGNPF